MIERDEAEDTIKAAAKAKNPNLYFEIKDVDLFAKELKTHVHCYREFTRGFNKSSRASKSVCQRKYNIFDLANIFCINATLSWNSKLF